MSDEAAKFVWKLARRHSCGSPIPDEQLIRLVAGTEDHDQLEHVLEEEVLSLSFVVQSPDGIYIPNGQDAHIAAADWLHEHTELDDFTITATLSRLPDDWPRDEGSAKVTQDPLFYEELFGAMLGFLGQRSSASSRGRSTAATWTFTSSALTRRAASTVTSGAGQST